MTNVNTDEISVSIANETSLGVLPGSPVWALFQPNTVAKYGPQIKTVEREPISKNLQVEKGKVVDLDSGVTITADIDQEILGRMLPNILHAKFTGPGKLTDGDVYRPTSVTGTGYVVAASGDVPDGTLFYASGFDTDANNGFKVAAGTSTTVLIKAAGLVAETSATLTDGSKNATLAMCGWQGAASDLSITVSSGITKLHSAGGINFTTLGLSDGQVIRVGGAAATIMSFANAANHGPARIAANGITATDLTLEKDFPNFVADAGTGQTVQVLFGRFIHNAARDDSRYSFTTATYEVVYPGLNAGVDEYHYAKGNAVDTATLDFPVTNKGTAEIVSIGTDTPAPTTSRTTGASVAHRPVQTDMYNTSSELVRLRATKKDETPVTADFLSAKLTIAHGVTGKKVLGYLGNKYLNRGLTKVKVESDILFTDPETLADVRANTTDTMEMMFRNSDGQGFAVDIPSLTLQDGSIGFPQHDQLNQKITFAGQRDIKFNYTVSFSLFPYLPD
jgi:hypothetical protein